MGKNKENLVNTDTALTEANAKTGFFSELWQQAKLVYKLVLDPEVPIYLKALPFAAVLYLLFPFDFLPDVVPGLGQLDDLTILIVGAKIFIELAPHEVVERHLKGLRAQGSNTAEGNLAPESETYGDDSDIIEGIIIDEGREDWN